jgi:hypothetical protein
MLLIVKSVIDKELGEWVKERSANQAHLQTIDSIRCDGFKRGSLRIQREIEAIENLGALHGRAIDGLDFAVCLS